MGQHKMEKEFSKKLNQREIIPSADAWDRLDATLTAAEETKPKRDFGWLYIAASILGFLFLGMLYFKNIPEVKDVPRNNAAIEDRSQKPSQEKETIIPAASESAIAVARTIKSKSAGEVPIQKVEFQSIQIKKRPQTGAVIAQNPKPSNESQSIITRAAGELAGGNQKTVQPFNQKAEELLANAETAQKSSEAKMSVKVNAKSLLSQVDGEVNLTFREKMLRKIGKNYKDVAEAVSNRNIEQ